VISAVLVSVHDQGDIYHYQQRLKSLLSEKDALFFGFTSYRAWTIKNNNVEPEIIFLKEKLHNLGGAY